MFLDEIQQTLRFLRSQECCRTAKARTPDKVFERLVEVVRSARGVADAGADDSVLDFLWFCRPNDPIRLVEMAEPADAGIEAVVLTGQKGVYAAAVDQAAEALHKGGRLWVATESAEQAEKVGTHLRNVTAKADAPPRILVVTARNKGEPDPAAFLKDPERQSRRWDCVIASPVIASGISIEHRDGAGEHFTRGFYLGTGQALTPADAAQQLRRVRYLRRFTIALAQNNSTGGRSVEAILKGREAAALDEGLARAPGALDHLIARFEAQEADAKADFAAGLWWLLEASGWTLSRGTVAEGAAADALRQIGRERAEDRARRLIEASVALADYSRDQIDQLRRTAATARTGPPARYARTRTCSRHGTFARLWESPA